MLNLNSWYIKIFMLFMASFKSILFYYFIHPNVSLTSLEFCGLYNVDV